MENQKGMMIRGRFGDSLDAVMEAINASIGFDQRMSHQDIKGSIAHVTMLAKQGIISEDHKTAMIKGLQQILTEIQEDRFPFSTALEDIHMNVESRLKEIIGDSAGRLHTARSRNDQVATDFRLWVRDSTDRILDSLQALKNNLLDKAEEGAHHVMPGFTHMQSAQPVTFGHHMMAYVEMFHRDLGRFQDARKRMNQCPLGAAALAGTSFPIDRHHTAEALGFDEPTRNSLDSVSDRDFALEYLAAASICATHLSRLAEEIVLWMSPMFGFVNLSDQWTTGSSIMPQKRNPDAAELVRGKTGRIVGSLVGLLSVMKALPLTFSKDMQEDKEQTFDAADNLELCLAAMVGMIADMTPIPENMQALAGSGYSTATDLADWLVRVPGLPFRDAHRITGQLVSDAERKGCQLEELSLEHMQAVEPKITQDIFQVLSVQNSIASRRSFGGTSPEEVKKQIQWWRQGSCKNT